MEHIGQMFIGSGVPARRKEQRGGALAPLELPEAPISDLAPQPIYYQAAPLPASLAAPAATAEEALT